MDILLNLEEKVRSLTEDFKATQWVLLYHCLSNQNSFFFRRSGGEKVEISSLDYPEFFKSIFSIKQEMVGNSQRIHFETGNLRNFIFGSSMSSSPHKDILVLPIFGNDRKTLRATIIAGETNPLSINSSLASIKAVEKKRLVRVARLLGPLLDLYYQYTSIEAELCYQKIGVHTENYPAEIADFNTWVHHVKKGITASDCFLYWIGDDTKLLWRSSTLNQSEIQNRILQFEKDWNPEQQVVVWESKNIPVRAKMKNKIESALVYRKDPCLVFTVPISLQSSEEILEKKNVKNKNYLVVEFSKKQNSSNKSNVSKNFSFSNSHYFYSLKAYDNLKTILNSSKTIISLKSILRSKEKSIQKVTSSSSNYSFKASQTTNLSQVSQSYKIDLYRKNQLELAIAQTLFTSENNILIKTDLKTGLNIGNTPSNFKCFQLKNIPPHERYMAISMVNYFQSQSVDISDYEKKIKHFFFEGMKVNPLIGYVILNLNSQTIPLKKSIPLTKENSSIEIISNGFHFLHYTFESGVLKKLPNYNYKFTFHPADEDIILAIPECYIKIIKEDLLKQMENDLVVFSHTFPQKLITSLGRLFGNVVREFLVIKKNSLTTL